MGLKKSLRKLGIEQEIMFAYGSSSARGGAIYVSDHNLVKKYKNTFIDWYRPTLDHRKISKFLAKFCTKHFKIWWPHFDSFTGLIDLLLYCGKWFDVWWPHVQYHIDWETNKKTREWAGRHLQLYRSEPIIALMMGCHSHIEKWWEPEKMNWKLYSKFIAWHCRKEFDIWWDQDKFNYDAARWLVRYCPDKWDVWWDPDKISYRRSSGMLCQFHSHRFDEWWDPKRFNWRLSKQFLIKYCPNHIEKWFDEIKFPFNNYEYNLFQRFCKENKNIWIPTAMLKRLESEDKIV